MTAGNSPNSEIADKPPAATGEQSVEQSAPVQTVEQGAHEQMLLDSQKPVNGNGSTSTETQRPTEQPASTQANTDNVKSIQVLPDGNTRFELKDNSVLVSKDGLPQKVTTPDGKTTEFEWRNGKLAAIKDADGTSWRFENGKWAHYGQNGRPDGVTRNSLDIFRFGSDRGVPTSGEITADMVRNMRFVSAGTDVATQKAGEQHEQRTVDQRQERSTNQRSGEQRQGEQRQGDQRVAGERVADQPAPTSDVPAFRASVTAASPETLMRAAETLRTKMSDRDLVEATILSLPRSDRQQLAETYQKLTGKSLKDALKEARLDSASAMLEPDPDASERAWLKENLDKLKNLPQRSETRDIVELSIRNQLRSLDSDQLRELDKELIERDHKSLDDVIKESRLSQPTKDILDIYRKGSENLTTQDSQRVADIGLNTRGLSEKARLFIVTEAFGGQTPAAKQAREEFLRNGGEAKLKAVFSDELNAREALDVAQTGRVHIATMIDRQKSSIGNNDAGIEGVVKNFMTPEDREMFKRGMALADKNPPPDKGTPEREAYDYYKRTHESLENASHLVLSMRLVNGNNRRKMVAIWEDIAMNGEETLLGRLAKTKNEFFATFESNKTVLGAIRNVSDKDFELMKDPAYRKRVFELVGGSEVGKPQNSLFADAVSKNAQQELEKVFGAPNVDEARRLARPTLKQIASYTAGTENADILNVLGKSKPSEWAALVAEPNGKQLQRTLEARVRYLPDGARESAQRMLDQLKNDKTPEPNLADRVYEDMLRGTAPREIIRNVMQGARDGKEQITNNPELEKALKASTSGWYDRLAKPLVEGRGLSIADLKELNWNYTNLMDAIAAGGGPNPNQRYGRLNTDGFFQDLRFASPADRQRLIEAFGKTDDASKQFVDRALEGLTDQQREVAINILKNPEQKMTLADKTRNAVIGEGNIDEVIGEFEKLNPQQKIELMNEYHQKYKTFMVSDLLRKADDGQKKQIETALPESLREAYRVQMNQAADGSRGSFGSSVPIEVAMRQTQEMIKLGLQKLPEADRQRYEREIRESLQKYTRALKDNDQAKDAYAKDLVDKITTVASLVAAPYAVANLTRLAVTGVAFAAFRTAVENNVKGESTAGDVTLAAIFGAVDVLPGPGEFKALFSAVGKEAVAATFMAVGTRAIGGAVSDQARERIGIKLGTAMEEAYKSGKGSLSDADVLKLVREEVSDPAKAQELSKTLKGELDKAIEARRQEMAKQLEQEVKRNGGGPLERVGGEQPAARVAPHDSTKSIEQFRGKFGTDGDQMLDSIHQLAKRAAEAKPPINPEYLKRLEVIAKGAGSPEKAKLALEVTERLLKNQLGDPITNDKVGLMAQIVRHSVDHNRDIPLSRVLAPDNQVESLQLYMRALGETERRIRSAPPITATHGDRYEYHKGIAIEKALNNGNLRGGNWVFVPGEKGSAADPLGIDGVLIDLQNNKVVPFDIAAQPGKAQKKIEGVARDNGQDRVPNPWVLPPMDYDRFVKPLSENPKPDPRDLERLRNHLSDFLEGTVPRSDAPKPAFFDVTDFDTGSSGVNGTRQFPSLSRNGNAADQLTQIHREAQTEIQRHTNELAAALKTTPDDVTERIWGEPTTEAALQKLGADRLSPETQKQLRELATKLRAWTFIEDTAFHGRTAAQAGDRFGDELTTKFVHAVNYRAAAGDSTGSVPMKIVTPVDRAGNNLEPFVKIDVKSDIRFGKVGQEKTISEVHVYSGGAIKIVPKDPITGAIGKPYQFGTIEDFVKHLEDAKGEMDPQAFKAVADELRQLSDLSLATRTPRPGTQYEIDIHPTRETEAALNAKHPGLTTLGRILDETPTRLKRQASEARSFLEHVKDLAPVKAMSEAERADLVRFATRRKLTGDEPIEEVLLIHKLSMVDGLVGKSNEDLFAVARIEKHLNDPVKSEEAFNQYLALAKSFERRNIQMNDRNTVNARLLALDHPNLNERQMDALVQSADFSAQLERLEKQITTFSREAEARRERLKFEIQRLQKEFAPN